MKKLLIVLALFIFSCVSGPEVRNDEGYVTWKDAPAWMVKDILDEDFGLIDGFSFVEDGSQFHVLLIDQPDNGLNGCDYWIMLVETSFNDRHGPNTPLVVVVGQGDCNDFDEMVAGIKSELETVEKEGI